MKACPLCRLRHPAGGAERESVIEECGQAAGRGFLLTVPGQSVADHFVHGQVERARCGKAAADEGMQFPNARVAAIILVEHLTGEKAGQGSCDICERGVQQAADDRTGIAGFMPQRQGRPVMSTG